MPLFEKHWFNTLVRLEEVDLEDHWNLFCKIVNEASEKGLGKEGEMKIEWLYGVMKMHWKEDNLAQSRQKLIDFDYANDVALLTRHEEELQQITDKVKIYRNSLGGSTSLSRCSCCQVNIPSVYAVSTPTPGAENDCPIIDFSMDINLYLKTHNCTAWTESYEMLHDLKLVVVRGIEDQCRCGVSMVYLSDVIFKCDSGALILSGYLLAKSQEQLQMIQQGYWNFISYHQFIYVSGKRVDIDKVHSNLSTDDDNFPAPTTTQVQPAVKRSLVVWEICVIAVGAFLLSQLIGLGSVYFTQRPRTTIVPQYLTRKEIDLINL
ncbi:uncharacterized protein LOC135357191 [Latimeria chalumnae]|uniref:uncharacterized protein LOC135357191 n=1 Tax=Latimeria chalumnae TaxID=7897 RepID=UPI0003C1234F